MDNPEKLTTLGTKVTRLRQTEHNNKKGNKNTTEN